MFSTNQKRFVIGLNTLLMLGLVAYSAINLILNKTIDPYRLTGEVTEAVKTRVYWIDLSNTILSVCLTIYFLGSIILLYNWTKKKVSFSYKSVFLYFISQIAIMFFGIVPFALFDNENFYGNYMIIFQSSAIRIFFILVFFLFLIVVKNIINSKSY